jgi:glycosyltransferase involved in cell wall biosynthesis
MALIEALQAEASVTLLTGKPFECDRLNNAYKTAVDGRSVTVEPVSAPDWLKKVNAGDALRGAYLGRAARQIASRFDICISAYNFVPFGRPALQFLADFSWDDVVRLESDPVSPGIRGLVQREGFCRQLYLMAVRAASGGACERLGSPGDVVVSNSRWSAEKLFQRHGIASRVIYPPVCAERFDPKAPRSGDFVLLGRIDPDKRVTEAIEVLARVRARGHKFNFHIIGPLDRSAYSSRVRALAKQHSDWVQLRGGLYGSEKFAELARHSFALHMRSQEAFGIAVAEQVKMGLIPFVPAGTAPAEIVGDARLFFKDRDHAVEIIDQVLRSSQDHASVLDSLAERAQLFSKERFIDETRQLLKETKLG